MIPCQPKKTANDISKILNVYLGSERFPVDIESIAKETTKRYADPLTAIRANDLNEVEGVLLPNSKRTEWAIFYNNTITHEGRISFTLAHEFGHYMLHRNQVSNDGLECKSGDMQRFGDDPKDIEKQANSFASCLLMPADDYRKQLHEEPISLDLLGHCAKRYGVSLQAAILRWLDFTPKRAILVVSIDGMISWAKSSTSAFKTGKVYRTRSKIYELPKESLAVHHSRDYQSRDGVRYPKNVWFPDEEVTEITIYSEEYDQTITLLLLDDVGGYDKLDE